jgi:predicted GH43/DUF377 family glycosyl hydrolase
VEKDGKVCVLYRAEDDPDVGIGKRTSRIGLVESADGVTIDYRSPSPVMYPDQSAVSKEYEWPGGTEDPRVVEAEVDGKPLYVMTFTSWNRSVARLSVATSRDLRTWTHHGPCFRTAYDGKFANMFCKSGSIVTEVKDGRLQATKIMVGGEEKYFMYWGESWVCGATSDDLITWTPIVDANTELLYLVKPRKGFFDSLLTECGPPAVRTADGIVLIYNGKNASGNNGDGCYAANTYAAGQMLFDRENPLVLLDRLDKPFFRPMDAFEKSGQYAAGTVFTEGLVYHQGKWFLYYGCADSFVGVAVCDPATALHEGDPVLSVQVPEGVVSQQTGIGTGKVRCFVNSCSGYAAEGERPANMLMSYIYPGRKWCDTSTEQPWIILEFTVIPDDDCLLRSDNSLGHGIVEDVCDVVYVKTDDNFTATDNPVIAQEIEQLNRAFLDRGEGYILVGPGRWGSSDHWLGIPVKWPHIAASRLIVEVALKNYRVNPSQGTHFFQNLTSFGVGYFTINDQSGFFRKDILDALPAVDETDHIRHVRFPQPLRILMDGQKQLGVVMKPRREGGVDALKM